MENSFYLANSEVSDDISLIKKCLEIYSITQDNDDVDIRLRPFELSLLATYIRKGISRETMEEYKEANNLKSRNINVTNYHLRQKGYIVKGSRSKMDKLSNHLEDLKEAFIKRECGVMVIRFEKG